MSFGPIPPPHHLSRAQTFTVKMFFAMNHS